MQYAELAKLEPYIADGGGYDLMPKLWQPASRAARLPACFKAELLRAKTMEPNSNNDGNDGVFEKKKKTSNQELFSVRKLVHLMSFW